MILTPDELALIREKVAQVFPEGAIEAVPCARAVEDRGGSHAGMN